MAVDQGTVFLDLTVKFPDEFAVRIGNIHNVVKVYVSH